MYAYMHAHPTPLSRLVPLSPYPLFFLSPCPPIPLPPRHLRVTFWSSLLLSFRTFLYIYIYKIHISYIYIYIYIYMHELRLHSL